VSNFDDAWQAAAVPLFSEFGDTATYRPHDGGTPVELVAILTATRQGIADDDRGEDHVEQLLAEIPRTAAAAAGLSPAGYVAEPDPADALEIDGTIYAIEDTTAAIRLTESSAILKLVRVETIARHRADFRHQG